MKSNLTVSSVVLSFAAFVLASRAEALEQDLVFKRGDANADSRLDLSDTIFSLQYLFLEGAEPSCLDAADLNDDGIVDLADPILSIWILFGGGAGLLPTGFTCNVDRTEDDLRCSRYASCTQPDRFFEVIDGDAVIEGDIVLGTVEKVLSDLELRGPKGGGGSVAVYDSARLWWEGVVPFLIENQILNATAGNLATLRNNIQDAIGYWEQRTLIRFVPRTTEDHFVTFAVLVDPNGACGTSPVGRVDDHFISLAAQNGNVASQGCIIHEIGHTIGLYHEQNRSDRDSYVTILWDNIRDEYDDQFEKMDDEDAHECAHAYDYSSVMHYSSTAFRVPGCGCNTIDSTEPIGQRSSISDGDLLMVNYLYGSVQNACKCAQDLATGSPPAMGRGGVGIAVGGIDLLISTFERYGEMTFPAVGDFFDVPVRIVVENRGSGLADRFRVVCMPETGPTKCSFIPAWSTNLEDPYICVAPGSSSTILGRIRFPPSALGEVRTVKAVADGPTSAIDETDETNNESSTIEIEFPDRCEVFEVDGVLERICWYDPPDPTDPPDVAVTAFEMSGDMVFPPTGGFQVPMRIEVKNLGEGIAGAFQVAIRRGTSTLKTWTVSSLAPKGVKTLTGTLSFSDSYLGTTVSLVAKADSADALEEPNERNNDASLSVDFPDQCQIITPPDGKPERVCW
jgi:hypothetical protein